MNVPQLRFSGFDGEWNSKFIGDLCEVKTGNKDTINKIDNGVYPFFVRSQTIERINSYSFDGEAILTAGDGVGVGKVFHYINGKFDFHQRVYMLSEFKDVNGKFIFFIFKNRFYREAMKYNAKTSVDSVRREMITKMLINLPSLNEQNKIATFISLLEKKIEKQQEKIEKLEQFKRGMMQKIFSQELRFKDEDGGEFPEWELTKMKEVTKKVGPRNKDDQKLPIYSINNKKGFLLQNEQFESSRLEDLEKTSYKIVRPNQFAYNPSRINVGSIGHLKTDFPVLISSLYVCFETKDGVNSLFMEQYVSSYNFNKEVSKNTEGSVREYLFYENFSNIKFPKPTLKEQQKIANYLNLLDVKIQKEEEKLMVLEEQKRGFMQGMFV